LLQWQPHRLRLHAHRASVKLQWQLQLTGQQQALQRLAASALQQLPQTVQQAATARRRAWVQQWLTAAALQLPVSTQA
jgi:hypothetical protein